MTEVRCVVERRLILGEGPCWDGAAGRLYWFDIKGRQLWWLEPATGAVDHVDLGVRASVAAPRSGGGLIVASDAGLGVFDPGSRALTITVPVDWPEGFRSNDGRIDANGRFWWSMMDDDEGRRAGCFFRTDPDWKTTPVVEGVHIANSCVSSPDGRTLYLADSTAREIVAYDMDPASGSLSHRRSFARTSPGVPDGSDVDAEGYLWNAEWGGWKVVRYAPDGRVDRVIEMPVSQPSCCTFGGPDLATLYVTSASEYLTEEEFAQQPLAGSLFAIDVGVRGVAWPTFAG
jgi:sugar lactone lactonase YvrE